ncbi:hypothetical protein ACU686_00725 [Yinghuangia aomiensis]
MLRRTPGGRPGRGQTARRRRRRLVHGRLRPRLRRPPTEVRANVPLPGGVHLLQVRCATGAGTPPDAIIAYTLGGDGRPDRGRTLLDTADDRIVKSLDVADGHATATLLGWSWENVPRCCPDQEETLQLIP